MKWIAVLFMTIDHLSYYFCADIPPALYQLGRGIGRLAFPLFAYLLVLGYRNTRSLPKYFARLASYALLTGLALNLTARAVNRPELNLYRFPLDRTGNNNILYTLAIALLLLLAYDLISKSSRDTVAQLRPIPGTAAASPDRPTENYGVRINLKGISLPRRTGLLTGTALALSTLILLWLTRPDYGLYGLTMILLFHILEEKSEPYTMELNADLSIQKTQLFAKAFLLFNLLFILLGFFLDRVGLSGERIFLSLGINQPIIQAVSAFAPFLFPLSARRKRPNNLVKHSFYIYYPLHLCLLILLRSLV